MAGARCDACVYLSECHLSECDLSEYNLNDCGKMCSL